MVVLLYDKGEHPENVSIELGDCYGTLGFACCRPFARPQSDLRLVLFSVYVILATVNLLTSRFKLIQVDANT